jgi:LCP family protein required for cell wall assembly
LPQYEVVSHVAPVSHEIPKKTPDTNIGREFPVKGAVPVTEVKKKKFSVKDMLVKTLAIVTSFLLIVLLILNMPILVYSKSGGETENVSIITFLKRWQPLNIEGDLEENTMDLKIDEEVVDDDFTDGLDLPQTVEGQYSVLFLGFDEAADNTDVIWVFQFDIAGGKINVLQIPRDTFVPYYTSSYTGKFNSIYNSGDSSVSNIQRVVNAVQDNFAIPIDAYVTTHCYDIVDMVDLVGGIPISLEEGILYEADKIIPKGDSILSGEQAGFTEGDIGRVKNQRKFLAAAMEKMLSIYSDEGKLTFYSYLKEIYENEYIHTDLSLEDISMIADFASNISLDNVQVNMVPGEGAWYYPDGHDRQSVWSVHKEETIAMLNEYFRPYQSDLTINESALVELTETHLSTANDDTSDTLQEIEDGEGTEAT